MLAKRPSQRPTDAERGRRDDRVALATHGPRVEGLRARRRIDHADGERALQRRATDDVRPPLAARRPRRAARPTRFETLRGAIAAHGGHLDVLADGSLLVTLEGAATPTDNAARAARCALAMRSLLPSLPMVLVAGQGEMKGNVADGRRSSIAAPTLLGGVDEKDAVRLDDVIAGLLDRRFEVRVDGGAISLVGELEASAP